ncbi:MAG: response regulator transcription factor [Spirochaetes bacterium]|nr:response regulator transcription factor [Spirochaetota bacterium]
MGNNIRRILIVDDHPLICRGLAEMINNEKDLRVCGEANDINSAMKRIADLKPDAVMVDLSLKSSSGIDLIKAIKARHPDLPALVYSMHDESVFAERVLRAGAKGYVMKDQPPGILLKALRKVLDGNIYFSDAVTTRLLDRLTAVGSAAPQDPVAALTDRELEIFNLMGQELTARQIAARLNISIKTVEAHRDHIKSKMGIQSSSDLSSYAKEWLQGRSG